MKKTTKFSLALFLFSILLTGCIKQDYKFEVPANFNRSIVQNQRNKPEDPFAIHNIRTAYKNLKSAGIEVPDIEVNPNHVYLRFLPRNIYEWDVLKKDSTLALFDFPLEYESEQAGAAGQDQSPADSSLMWQYSVIPLDQKIPDVYHEVIYEVFIPPVEDAVTRSSSVGGVQFYQDLVSESVRLTGNQTTDNDQDFTSKSFSSGWRPKGTIRAWDDVLDQFIPLQGVKVNARWFTHIETAVTDENGFFETKKFRFEVHYSVKWETPSYSIRNGLFLQAWFNGPRKRGDWNLDISEGESLMYATIHRAAYKSFYGDNLGISRPLLRNGGQTKICYRNGNGAAEFRGDWTGSGIFPDILVWGKSNDKYKSTQKIFGNTAHELGHQAHSLYIGNLKYYKTSKIIRESWADAVEWALANDEYHKLGEKFGHAGAAGYNHNFNSHNSWPFVDDKNYSPIFIDLIDRINQRISIGEAYPNDLITGYTLSYINYYLLGSSFNITSLNNVIKAHKLDEIDDLAIEELFTLYY